jgi:hypothetical protein
VADAPWRCSECGTVNEPVANACRTCGRWPSLFDLEDSKLEDLEPRNERAEPLPATLAPFAQAAPEPVVADEPGSVETEAVEETEDADVESSSEGSRPWRRFVRLAVPIAVVLYIAISSVANR